MEIVIDSREQAPLDFRKSEHLAGVVRKKLDAGDYSIRGFEDRIAIERKSPIDFFGTLGKGHERFKREIERAQGYDYFGILVELSFTKIRDKDFPNSWQSRMRGDVILQIAYTLKMKYKIDIIFCNDRAEASSIVRNIFRAYYKLHQWELPHFKTTMKDPKTCIACGNKFDACPYACTVDTP